jgi:hypothetical protein
MRDVDDLDALEGSGHGAFSRKVLRHVDGVAPLWVAALGAGKGPCPAPGQMQWRQAFAAVVAAPEP